MGRFRDDINRLLEREDERFREEQGEAGTATQEQIAATFRGEEQGGGNVNRLAAGLGGAILESDAIPSALAQGTQLLEQRGRLDPDVEAKIRADNAADEATGLSNIMASLRGSGQGRRATNTGTQAILNSAKRGGATRAGRLDTQLDLEARDRQSADVGPAGVLAQSFLNPAQTLITSDIQKRIAEANKPREQSGFERALGFAMGVAPVVSSLSGASGAGSTDPLD